jgi:hypothetical protein
VGEIDITAQDEIRLVTNDPQRLHESLLKLNILPQDENRIANAFAAERGVTVEEFVALLTNAAVNIVAHNLTGMRRPVGCNLDPACLDGLGHAGGCETEVPF